jgi:hypothetical protein
MSAENRFSPDHYHQDQGYLTDRLMMKVNADLQKKPNP